MHVMRNIVLHALDIQQQQQQQDEGHQTRPADSLRKETPPAKKVKTTAKTSHASNMMSETQMPALEPRKPHPSGPRAMLMKKLANSHSESGSGTSSTASHLSGLSSGFESLKDEGSTPMLEWGERGGVSLSPSEVVNTVRQRERVREDRGHRSKRRGVHHNNGSPGANIADSQGQRSTVQAWERPSPLRTHESPPSTTHSKRYAH